MRQAIFFRLQMSIQYLLLLTGIIVLQGHTVLENSKLTKTELHSENCVDKEEPKYATLRLYRQHRMNGGLRAFNIYVGSRKVWRAGNNKRTEIKLEEEGLTEVWGKIAGVRSTVTLDVEFGQVYYVKCNLADGGIAGEIEMIAMTEKYGKEQYDKTRD